MVITYLNYIVPAPDGVPLPANPTVLTTGWKLSDLEALGAPLVRQMQSRDLTWEYMEPAAGHFAFERADELIGGTTRVAFIGTLFAEAGARADLRLTPWDHSDSAPARQAYVEAVVGRYADRVDLWEIGNENASSWAISDLMTPEIYAGLLREVVPTLRAADPTSHVITSGLVDNWGTNLGADPKSSLHWLDGVLAALGSSPDDYVDAVDCHLYGDWFRIPDQVRALRSVLSAHGSHARILVGETGESSDPANQTPLPGTNNVTQAARVFTRMALAAGAGAAHASWFSHIDDFGDKPSFHGYGSVWHSPSGPADIARKPSWYSLQLLYSELGGFDSAEIVSEGAGGDGQGSYVVRFVVGGRTKYVAWNQAGGHATLANVVASSGAVRLVSTVCRTQAADHGALVGDEWPLLDADGAPSFAETTAPVTNGGVELDLTATPVLVLP